MAENIETLNNDEQPTQENPIDDNIKGEKKEKNRSSKGEKQARRKHGKAGKRSENKKGLKNVNPSKKADKNEEKGISSGKSRDAYVGSKSENAVVDSKATDAADSANAADAGETRDAGNTVAGGDAGKISTGGDFGADDDSKTAEFDRPAGDSKTGGAADGSKDSEGGKKGFFSNFSAKPVKAENYDEIRRKRKEKSERNAGKRKSQGGTHTGSQNGEAELYDNQKALNFRAKIANFRRAISRSMTRKNKRIALYIITLCILLAIVTIVPTLSNAFSTTMSVEYGTLRISDTVECYVIKDETLYFANKNGDIDYNYEEGKIVRAGSEIVTLEDAAVEKASALGPFKDRADDFLSGETLYNTDKETLTDVIKELQLTYDDESDESTAEQISMYIDRLTDLKNRDGAERKSDTDYSPLGFEPETYEIGSPGYVSYIIDGYEAELNPLTMTLLNKDKVSKIDDSNKNLKRSMTLKHEPLFKIVDNTGWYVTFWIDESDMGKYNVGNEVELVLDDAQLNAKVDSVIDSDGDIQVILKSTEYYENLPTLRKMNIEVVTSDSSGLIIKNSFLASEDDMTGVYVRDIDGSVEFTPVKVKSTDGEYSIVESGYFTVYDKETELTEQYKTVNVFDEIVKPD